jgi:predicted nucleic acid-binding protein
MNNTIVVVDASIAVKWVIEEIDSHVASALLAEWSNQRKLLVAPDLFLYEVANILRKKVRRNFITPSKAHQAAILIWEMGIETRHPISPELWIEALEIAHAYNLPASYDAHYLELAAREQCEFWTADERMYNSVKGQLSWVRLMSDFASVSSSD